MSDDDNSFNVVLESNQSKVLGVGGGNSFIPGTLCHVDDHGANWKTICCFLNKVLVAELTSLWPESPLEMCPADVQNN